MQQSLYEVHKAFTIYLLALYRKSVLVPTLQSLVAAYGPPSSPFFKYNYRVICA